MSSTTVLSAPLLFQQGPCQDKFPLQISVPLSSCQGISGSHQLFPSRQQRIPIVSKTPTRGPCVHILITEILEYK